MRYGVPGKLKKGIALALSIALVICTAPAIPVFAEETSETVKQVNFGMVNNSGTTADTITLSISPNFNKPQNIADGKVEAEEPGNPTSWILATEKTTDSMEAKVKDNKIILTENYGNRPDYDEEQYYNIKAEHETAASVLSGATDVAAVISTEDNKEILYYGNLDGYANVNAQATYFKIPAGLGKGNYNLYIFAESNSTTTPKTIYTSALGTPIKIEVVSSLKFDITGLDEPEAGKEPDTQAVLKIQKGNSTEEKNVDITWKDELGITIQGEFEYNRNYYASASLDGHIEGYIADVTSVSINGGNAEFYEEENVISNKFSQYQTKPIDTINISGAVGSGSNITLKAYTGIIPPSPSASPDAEYTYEWWNSKLDTSRPVYTGQSHVLTQGDFDVTMEVRLKTSKQDNAASKEIDIRGGLLETSVIEGVTKTDETVKGKADGLIEGLSSGMMYSLDGGNTYSQCTSGTLENLAAGTTCRIKIEENNLIPAGVTGIYADYVIGGGSPLTVSFDSDGGSSVNAIEGIAYNTLIEEPANPVRDGYTFAGWYKDTEGKDKWDFSGERVTQDIRLIAKWNKNQAAEPGDDSNKNTPVPGETTPEPGNDGNKNTPVPGETTPEPGNDNNKNTPVPGEATLEPDNSGNKNTPEPDGTTQPSQTATPEPTRKPQAANNGVVSPYIPQTTQQTQTAAPAQTEQPSQEPAQTEKPSQTAEPESQPSQNPETTIKPAEPGNQPSQEPDGEDNTVNNNTGDNNNTPADNTSETANPMPEGEKAVAGGAEYTSTGNSTVVLSNIVTEGSKIVIPGTINIGGKSYKVVSIEEGAFKGSKVKNVKIGSNIKTIGKQAFKGCKKLTTVTFPSGVQTIGSGAFRGCKSLKKVTLPSTVKSIKRNAFKNCKGMKSFTLGTAKSIKANKTNKRFALRAGTNAVKVTIGASALENCADLRSVVINSEVTKIGNSTFKYCSQLRKMLVKSLKLQKVGNQALKGVSNCKITVPPVKLKPYTTLFKNKGQGKKVVVAKS